MFESVKRLVPQPYVFLQLMSADTLILLTEGSLLSLILLTLFFFRSLFSMFMFLVLNIVFLCIFFSPLSLHVFCMNIAFSFQWLYIIFICLFSSILINELVYINPLKGSWQWKDHFSPKSSTVFDLKGNKWMKCPCVKIYWTLCVKNYLGLLYINVTFF